jgi:hypothetical protein
MPNILTTNAQVFCPHGGRGTSIPTDLRWTINGGTVLLDGDQGGIAGCLLLVAPCVKYDLRSMRLNATSVGGRPVMLTTDLVLTNTGFPVVMVETHQVIDNSVPAPIPVGQPAPALPPELGELDKPTVVAVPSSAVMSMTGPELFKIVTFTLGSRFPKGWLLTFARKKPPGVPLAPVEDWTAGVSGRVNVTPSGGTWDEVALTVVVKILRSLFLSLVDNDENYLTLTGFNQRGLAGYAQVLVKKTP